MYLEGKRVAKWSWCRVLYNKYPRLRGTCGWMCRLDEGKMKRCWEGYKTAGLWRALEGAKWIASSLFGLGSCILLSSILHSRCQLDTANQSPDPNMIKSHSTASYMWIFYMHPMQTTIRKCRCHSASRYPTFVQVNPILTPQVRCSCSRLQGPNSYSEDHR